MSGEVSIEEKRPGASPGIVDEPRLIEMKPALNTTDEFEYLFAVRVKGSPSRARKLVADRAAELISGLPDELQDAFLKSYQEIGAANHSAKQYMKQAQEENRRLMEATDAQEKLNAELRAAIEKAEAEAKVLKAQREGWRSRIDALVNNRANQLVRSIQQELNAEHRRAEGFRKELERLKSAIRTIGDAFRGGDIR